MTICHLYELIGTSFFEVCLVSHQVVHVITIAQEPFLEVASARAAVISPRSFALKNVFIYEILFYVKIVFVKSK